MAISLRKEPRLLRWKLSLYELWSRRNHAQSFNTTRHAYLKGRLQALCVIWAAANLVWIAIDFAQLSALDEISNSQTLQLSALRLLFATSALYIASTVHSSTSLLRIKFALTLLVIAANLFYFSASLVLDFPFDHTHYSFSYAMLPLIHIVVLAIFPLTASECLLLIGITFMTQYSVTVLGGHEVDNVRKMLFSFEGITAVMVAWSQLSQLHMIMKLYRHATLDPLTGVYNRRMLMTQAQQRFDKRKNKKSPFTVILFDLDKFKRVNDRYGHFAGDRVLEAFAKAVQSRIREEDIFGRFGGEEFILFLSDCSQENANKIATRILNAVRTMVVDIGEDKEPIQVTVSIGLHTTNKADDLYSALEKADASLYQAKAKGRDQIQRFEETLSSSAEESKRPWLEYSS
ncbi:GGDEF domain-containing protein [Veronia nyctiphanis]|uniref:diguanylate cyclase n=1 Tax=Veronia nyctiphanis TaxID=1278244 RepID=A0A4Q0Z0K2_9GAMM|nr:GGDEF domain-containing protein [Veronia nyctiphanis]RXJ74941.1 GGDEF domain-containing protein [Veronia nyctiphanis]